MNSILTSDIGLSWRMPTNLEPYSKQIESLIIKLEPAPFEGGEFSFQKVVLGTEVKSHRYNVASVAVEGKHNDAAFARVLFGTGEQIEMDGYQSYEVAARMHMAFEEMDASIARFHIAFKDVKIIFRLLGGPRPIAFEIPVDMALTPLGDHRLPRTALVLGGDVKEFAVI